MTRRQTRVQISLICACGEQNLLRIGEFARNSAIWRLLRIHSSVRWLGDLCWVSKIFSWLAGIASLTVMNAFGLVLIYGTSYPTYKHTHAPAILV